MDAKTNLVLSRQVGEQVVFRIPPSTAEQEVFVTVVSLSDGKARLGCEAEPNVKINRREVQDAIDRDGFNKRGTR